MSDLSYANLKRYYEKTIKELLAEFDLLRKIRYYNIAKNRIYKSQITFSFIKKALFFNQQKDKVPWHN